MSTTNLPFDVAIEGCAHGELDIIYDTIRHANTTQGRNIKLLLCCGDFQSVRDNAGLDLSSMAVPKAYRRLNSFHHYYDGTKRAPCLTIFIGGNHEASQYLWELPYGGWVAPLIYYAGWANVINFVYEEALGRSDPGAGHLDQLIEGAGERGLPSRDTVVRKVIRIAGLSGIYKWRDYQMGHYETPPFTEDAKRSIYHIRGQEVARLGMLNPNGLEPTARDRRPAASLDVCLSHDWPCGIWEYGDVEGLLRLKPFLSADIAKGELGSGPASELLHRLQPRYWFAAHLHVKFPALVIHPPSIPEPVGSPRPDSSDASDSDTDPEGPENSNKRYKPSTSSPRDLTQSVQPAANGDDQGSRITKFLALDKCLPRRPFLQILPSTAFGESGPVQLSPLSSYLEIDTETAKGCADYLISTPDVGHQTGSAGSGAVATRCYLAYDNEWLSILKRTDYLLGLERCPNFFPAPDQLLSGGGNGGGSQVTNFAADLAPRPHLASNAALSYVPIIPTKFRDDEPDPWYPSNPQTVEFCERLGITDPCEALLLKINKHRPRRQRAPTPPDHHHGTTNPQRLSGSEERMGGDICTIESPITLHPNNSKLVDGVPVGSDITCQVGADYRLNASEEFESLTNEDDSGNTSARARPALSLPLPSNVGSKGENESVKKSSDFKSPLLEVSSSHENSMNSGTRNDDAVSHPPKLLKRRNQSVYQKEISEDD